MNTSGSPLPIKIKIFFIFFVSLFLACQKAKNKVPLEDLINSNDPNVIEKGLHETDKEELNQVSHDGTTPLTKYLIQNTNYGEKHQRIITEMLESGANPNTKTKIGLSPLFIAINNNDVIAVETLINYGANIHERTFTGESLIEIASKLKREEVQNLIFEKLE